MAATDTDEAATNTTPEATQKAVAIRIANKGKRAIEKKNKTLERISIIYVPLWRLRPNEYNPNRQSEHDFELLVASMREDGFTQPVVVTLDSGPAAEMVIDNATGESLPVYRIVDGEHRWRAAEVLGLTEIPVVVVDMDEAQRRISTLRHNRARGSHDVTLEAEVLRELQAMGALEWAVDSLILDDTELNLLLNDVAAPEAMAGEVFSEAWIPDKFTDEEAALIRGGNMTTAAQTIPGKNGDVVVALTAGAIEQTRRRERLVAEARTEQERQRARVEDDTFRISLTFSRDEARIVRAVLGGESAETLLRLCREELERRAVPAALAAGAAALAKPKKPAKALTGKEAAAARAAKKKATK